MAGSIREAGETRVTEGITPEGTRALNESARIQDESASRNAPQRIIDSIPKLHAGGTVPADGAYNLQAGEKVEAAPAQPDASTRDDSNLSDDESTSGAPVSLQKAYSLLNERICQLFDASGVRRNFSIPYLKNQSTADHVASLSQQLPKFGGVTKTFISTFHHAGGKGWHSEDGSTTGHPIESLKKTIITKDNPDAIAALSAAKSFLNKISGLIGDTKSVQTAKSQLAMVGKQKGAGMDLMDFGSALIALVTEPLGEIARMHSDSKSHGPNHAKLTGPRS